MNKKLILPLLLGIALAGIVYGGTCDITKPESGDTISGTKVSFEVNATATASNCSISGTSALTGDTWNATVLGNFSSGAVNLSNGTVDTYVQVDASDWSFTFTCINRSGTVDTCTSTGVIVDNTNPVITSFSPSTGSADTDGSVAFSTTCTNATAATLYLNSVPYTMTESSDSCTLTLNGLPQGTNSWYVVGSDGADTTTSATQTIDVRNPGGALPGQTGATVPTPAGTGTQSIFGGGGGIAGIPIGFLVVVGLAWWLFFRKK